MLFYLIIIILAVLIFFFGIIPIIDKLIKVNITEQMVDAMPQEIITNDNLNATVDAQVYFKVRDDEQSVKNSQYNLKLIIGNIVLRIFNTLFIISDFEIYLGINSGIKIIIGNYFLGHSIYHLFSNINFY